MKKIVIVDVDGTVSNSDHRQYLLQSEPKQWDAFFEACDGDSPHSDICRLVFELWNIGYDIVFCSGRTESTRQKTRDWLAQWVHPDIAARSHLLMRKDGDHRHDIHIKPELVAESGINLKDVAFILEDRDSMVAKWREMGLRVLQVAPGAF